MGIFIKRSSLLPSFSMPSIPTTVRVDMFFDRTDVINALSAMERKSLIRATMLVRRAAYNLIRPMGLAKPKLKEQEANRGMRLEQILPQVTDPRRRRVIIKRIREIQRKPPSPPGQPPHTHTPYRNHQYSYLGFRRNLYNGFDATTRSGVVGPDKKGEQWTIPKLHEFGGSKVLRQYVLVPKYPRYNKPIVKWVDPREKVGQEWVPTGRIESKVYPARPFMAPALEKTRTKIAACFAGQFSAGVVRG